MLIVKKFGGTSVADKERIFNVARRCIEDYQKGNDVVVVLSAMGKYTDELITMAKDINEIPPKREMDMLFTIGEQMSVALMAMAMNKLGVPAISLNAFQVAMHTTSVYGNARLKRIDVERIRNEIEQRKIVIITGFQGINKYDDYTTLGRGGSDTTAVALAASLKAERCDIYTDVDGVFTSDPRIVKNVKQLSNVSYEEMLEMSSMGAKVLHNRCVEIGQKYNVPIYVKSTFEKESVGTLVSKNNLEDLVISGVTKDDYISRITIVGLENKIGKTYELFKILSNNRINVDVIVQSFGEYITKDIAFTVKMNDLNKTLQVLNENKDKIGAKDILHTENLSKVSIIGVGIANKPGVATGMFEALYENNINMHMITTSEIKISVLVNSNMADLAVKAIHEKFID